MAESGIHPHRSLGALSGKRPSSAIFHSAESEGLGISSQPETDGFTASAFP
jgi:hypothetical protein